MKLFRKRKKNNRGFSLVEMICAIAVLSLTSTAIGSAMVMSTKNYQRGNAEVDVQKEAQTTTNLIGNLLVDAVDAKYKNGVLTIDGEGVTYVIEYNASEQKLTYKETQMGGSTLTGTLAENVSGFDVDLGGFDSTTNTKIFDDYKNAKVDLSIEKNGKDYDASYNTTARNRDAFNVGSVESAVIVCETELVLEPNQTFTLPVKLYGNPNEDGLEWGGKVLTGSNVGSSQLIDANDDGVKIYVGPDAKGSFTFVIATKADNGGIPLDTKTVTVRVRRANSITPDAQITGDLLKSGTTYRIYADVASDNAAKIIGKDYDNDYINPNYVDFQISTEGGAMHTPPVVVEDVDRPYVELQLTSDVPAGGKITIDMTSKHAAGDYSGNVHNKKAMAYDPGVTNTYVIENTQGAVWVNSGIMRGNDNMLFESTLVPDTIKSKFGGEPRWYYRYRENTSGAPWTQFYRTEENGTAKKFNAGETRLWLPDKGYEIEMMLLSVSGIGTATPKLEYPQDTSMLLQLQSYWPGLEQGWTEDELTDSDKAPYIATTFNQYGGRMEIAATKIMYDAGGTMQEQYGTESSPGFVITKDTGEVNITWDTTNLTRGHYGYSYRVYKSEGSGWVDVTSIFKDNYATIELDNSKFKIYNVVKNGDGTVKNTGYFKIVPSVVGEYKSIGSTSRVDTGIVLQSEGDGSWTLGDDTGKGCVFFKIQ